jgi:diacylglycerol kinase (ATP)
MKALSIINPAAGKGKALEVWRGLQPELQNILFDLDWQLTSCQGDATAIAKDAAAQGYELIISCGGDGTLNEIVNGIVGSPVALAVIPAGSGNDFARSLGLPKDPQEAVRIIAAGHKSPIDLGLINGRCFLNMAGLGFDADVAHRINGKRILQGQTAYLAAVLQTLAVYKSYHVEIVIDEQKITEEAILVSVGNGRYVGGGFCLLPRASLADGLLDVMVVRKTTRIDIIKNLPALYKGAHEKHPKCSFYRGREVIIRLIKPGNQGYAQVDGQEFSDFPLRIAVMPQALEVLVP